MTYDKCALMMRLAATFAIAVLTLSACSSGGGGSTSSGPVTPWMRFRHDAENSGFSPNDVGALRGVPAAIPVDDGDVLSPITSSPAIGPSNEIYVGSEAGTFRSLDGNGNTRWAVTTCSACPGSNQALGPLRSSPAVYYFYTMNQTYLMVASTSGRVYEFLDNGSSATCTACFDPIVSDPSLATGPCSASDWTASFSSSPAFQTHTQTGSITGIYIGATLTQRGQAKTYGKLYALNVDGTLQWSYPSGCPTAASAWPNAFTSSPALVTPPALFITSDGGTPDDAGVLHAVTPGGVPMWKKPIGSVRDPDTFFAQSPVPGLGAIFVNTAAGKIEAISTNGQAIGWILDIGAHFPGATFASSMVLSSQVDLGGTPTPTPTVTVTPPPPTRTGTVASPTPSELPTASPSMSPTATTSPTATPAPVSPTPTLTSTPTATPTAASLTSTLFAVTKQGHVVVVAVTNGAFVPLPGPEPDVDGEVLSSPAMSNDGFLVFATTNGTLYSVSGTTGVQGPWDPIQLAPGSRIVSSPAIDGNGTIWVGADNGYLYRVAGQ